MNTETIVSAPGAQIKPLVIYPFIFAGNATFTVVSKSTAKRFTFKVHAGDYTEGSGNYFVSVLNGPDNQYNYLYMGMLNKVTGEFRSTRNSRVDKDAASWTAFAWFSRMLITKTDLLDQYCEVWHEGKCGRCGRKLTVPSSIELGIGPECANKLGD